MKIPNNKALARDFCNYVAKLTIQHGMINLNKKFLMKVIKWFVYLDTLKNIIKRAKRLIQKIHEAKHFDDGGGGTGAGYNDEFGDEFREVGTPGLPPTKTENVIDTDIPKQFNISIEEGLTLIITDPNQTLRPFLNAGENINRDVEVVCFNFNPIIF